MATVAFSWNGLPQYAARLIRGAIDHLGVSCEVIGSPPEVPVQGMEEALGQPVHWVDASRRTSWSALGLAVPEIYFQSGWRYPAFASLGAEVRRSGGVVVGISDANWRGDFRQLILGAIAFRLLYRRHFKGMLVPGVQGERLMKWYGVDPAWIRQGMLGAEPKLYEVMPRIDTRKKAFLFVGQFIDRKDVLGLAESFKNFAKGNPDWTLHLVGGGPQAAQIPKHKQIIVEDFVQPEDLAQRFADARYFVLPSKKEAWGLVVHEAALAGCGLILSDRIGSADDLCTSENGLRFRAGDVADLTRALEAASRLDDAWLVNAAAVSQSRARSFGPNRFGVEAAGFIARIGDR